MEGLVINRATMAHKRPAEDSLESEQRLAKRFNLLNLGMVGTIYLLDTADESVE